MTIDEAIETVKHDLAFNNGNITFMRALGVLVGFAEYHKEAEKNEPLTESELDSIKEAPLYVVPLEKEDALPGWCIYKSKNGLAVFRLKNHFNGMYFPARKDYGKKWLAYRHPPKEAHDGADT